MIRVGLVGAGKVAHFHAKAFQKNPDVELVSVWDRKPEHAESFAKEYGLKPYSDLEAFLSNDDLQLVSVVTPHPYHLEPTIEAADHGINVLVEKPLTITLADAKAILAAEERNHVVISMISQRRFFAPSQRMRAAIDAGKIGKPVIGSVMMNGWRSPEYYDSDPWRGKWDTEGGGVLVNQAPHQLDLLLWYMGSEPVEVYGVTNNFNHPTIEVEDTANAIVKFANGAVGNILVSNSQNPSLYGKVHIFGDNGATIGVQTDGSDMFVAGMSTIDEPAYNDIWTVNGETELLEDWQQEDAAFFKTIDATTYYHEVQIGALIEQLEQHQQPDVTAADGLKVVQLFQAIYESSRTGLPVKMADLK